MLTCRETDLLLASELDERFRIKKELFYTAPKDLPKHTHNEQTGKYTCGFCNKSFGRKDYLTKHINSCPVRILTERFEHRDFKSYEVQQDTHRLKLMMPYNPERGIRMYISGPPRSGKSYLIGQLMRECVRHQPKRTIYLFSQVSADRAIDTVVEDMAVSLKWKQQLF